MSYQVPITTTVTFDGQQFTSVYATTNSVITFGRPDNTYWTYPGTPSISLYSMDWFVYPQRHDDEHLTINSSDGGFQVDIAARPCCSGAPTSQLGDVTNIIITAAINTDGTVAIAYSFTGPTYGNATRTGVRLNDGSIVTLEQYGVVHVETSPTLAPDAGGTVITPEPSASPSASLSSEPSPSPSPSNSPSTPPSPSPSPSPSQTPTETPSPSPSPSPLPSDSPAPSPTPTPEVTLSPEPTVAPPPAPEPSPTPVPEPSPRPDPVIVPVPPAVEPEPSVMPPEPPALEPEPSPEPSPEEVPVPLPTPDPQPQIEQVDPTPQPEPSPEPEPQPTPEPEPAPQPTPEPAPEPAPEPELNPSPEPPSLEEKVTAILDNLKPGESVSAQELADAGIEYKDLPPETPVEVRQDENGNEVIITADVAAALVLLENPSELLGAIFNDPGQAVKAFLSIGADMSTAEREESTKAVVATVIAAGAAINAVGAATSGSTGNRSNSGGGGASGESGYRRRKP